MGRKHINRVNGKGKFSRWPCTGCKEECSTDAIFCEQCCQWAHYSCENLTKEDFQQLSKILCAYVCSRCSVDQYGKFDFIQSLQRLCIASSNMKDLHHAAILEQILLKSHPFQQSKQRKQSALPSGYKIHKYSQFVVNLCGTASRVPVDVKGDGNCLFNSVSVAIQGDETLSSELRVLTCLELVLNFAYFKNHPHYEDFRLVSPDLVEASRMCAIDGKFSSIFTVQGLSSVINRAIVSVYLPMNGMLDNCVRILNTVISPRRHTLRHGCRDRVYVLWTRVSSRSIE